jgi:hypothetical protein
MPRWSAGGLALALLPAVFTSPVKADVLTVSNPFNYVDEYGVNTIGNGPAMGTTGYYAGGEYDSVAVESVTPVTGTTVTATQDGVSYNVPFLGGGAFPDQFFGNLPLNPNLTGSWTLTATNPDVSNSPVIVSTPALTVTTPPPSVTGVSLSGNGAAPTINWSIPSGSAATSETVYVYNVPLQGGALFSSGSLPAGTTTYTLPPGTLTAGSNYTIAVQSDVSASGTLEARTRSFTASFTAASGSIASPIYLPTVAPTLSAFDGPIYDFDAPVTAGVPIAIDPELAVGYIYQTGAGDPNFASVELPDIGNPDLYDLYLWNGASFLFDTTLAADTVFDFAAGGVNEFEVLGIDPDLGLDPSDAAAFITNLTFVGDGTFTGTMTPVTENAVVPEPASIALFVPALLGLAAPRFRRPARALSRAAGS